jgi:hypothetical protein
MKLDGPQSWLGRGGKDKNSAKAENRTTIVEPITNNTFGE